MSELNVGKLVLSDGIVPPSVAGNAKPANPIIGTLIYNTTTNTWERWDGNNWNAVSEDVVDAIGGNLITYSNGFKIHTFIGDGTFQVLSGSTSVEYLIVAGGGSGGRHHGGGGGGGGVQTGIYNVTPGNYSIVVGGGGAATAGANSSPGGQGGKGLNSSAFGVTAEGGGGGGNYSAPGAPGGSGGGATNWGTNTVGGNATGVGRGFPGASNAGSPNYGGGGGGAGGRGGTSTFQTPQVDNTNIIDRNNGGTGFASTITGRKIFFAGGGASGTYPPESRPYYTGSTIGGIGGGGYGGVGPHGAGDQGGSGLPNSGGGGGGTASYNSLGGNGGSGIVIIRYKIF